MNAIVLERYGPPDLLALREVPTPAPKAGDVLVRVHAASINDWDWAVIRGTPFITRLIHGLKAPNVRTPGCDVAGTIEAVGEGVTAFAPGDEVYGDLCEQGFGAFAEYACAPAATFARKPAGMTFEQAAAIPQAGMLAVQGLFDVGKLQDGEHVLLNGAGGGVGTLALQMARLHRARVTAVDSGGKLDMLRAMGADEVIDYRQQDFTRTGHRYDLVLDVKTNRPLRAYARALKPGGRYATVGGTTTRLLQIFLTGPAVSRVTSRHLRVVALKPNKDLAYINGLFEAGQLTPVIDRTYPLAELPEAMRFYGTGEQRGKVVITMR